MDYQNLSRTGSHAVRHEPWLYELELDDAGWVPLTALLAALRVERREWRDLGLA
ncbi:RNA 2'-phosphotransferase, partial [Pseudomonas sp. MWU13-2860]